MLISQVLLTDRQRSLQQRLRFFVLALYSVEFRQIVQATSGVGMLRPNCLSLIANARSYNGSASSYLPWFLYRPDTLFRL